MDAFLTHVKDSARSTGRGAKEQRAFVLSFRDESRDPMTRVLDLDYPADVILDVLLRVLGALEFDVGAGADFQRSQLHALFSREYDTRQDYLGNFPNLGGDRIRLGVSLHARVDGAVTELRLSHRLPSWLADFEGEITTQLEKTSQSVIDDWRNGGSASCDTRSDSSSKRSTALPGTMLGPGEELTADVRGAYRDYSGLAAEHELEDLHHGDIPLGRYRFDGHEGARPGRPLFLSKYRTGAAMLHNGALICAPQNSGKTQLIVRWAQAANAAGHGVFVIDVKGNMHDKLADRLQGTVRYFSTDADVDHCDRINFIAGLHGTTPRDSMRVRQIADALLPREGWEQGEQAYFHQNHVNWLSGLLHLLLLYGRAVPAEFDGQPALGDLYELAADEQRLLRLLENLRRIESVMRLPPPGAAYWKREIALLLHPADGGQRSPEYSFRTLTQSAVNALRPFSSFGTLHEKTGGLPSAGSRLGPLFALEDLEDDRGPVTIILAARAQDLDDASTVTSLAVQRLQQILFQRMTKKRKTPVLLLLDETRRIPGFKANEYVTFAREAEAGCVVSYQSLDQVGEPPEIAEMLENVGTQIYLGSLVGATARYFVDVLPTRLRPRYSRSSSVGSGYSRALDVELEEVSYITSNELFRLPAGRWPALVYINDQPRRKPFLVDLDQDVAALDGAIGGKP